MPSLSPQQWLVFLVLASLVLLAAVKLVWGMALWAMKGEHRLGQGFGVEPVEVVEWTGGEGLVRAGGELWKAVSSQPLAPGERVEVANARGLVLEVRRPDKSAGLATTDDT